MKNNRIHLILLFVFASALCISAQEPNDSHVMKTKLKPFLTLYHQHHDFFGKAFSFQGLEVGVIIKRDLLLGLYGSCFVTNLKTEFNNNVQFTWIGQSGINVAHIFNVRKKIHPGVQLNTGIFSLRKDEKNFGLFQSNSAEFKLTGLVISPQIFGELNITDWFKIRTGLSYNFYIYKDHSVIKTSDLNHISFTFGLVFMTI